MTLATWLLRGAGCAIAAFTLWRLLGPIGLAITAPLWGIAFARPLIELAGTFWHHSRHAALADLAGRHYAHAGHPLEVLETPDARWLRAVQVQRLLGDTAPELAFVRRFGPGEALELRPGHWFLRDAALVDYLERSPQAMDARRNGFRLFLEREVIDPHRRARRQGGRRPG